MNGCKKSAKPHSPSTTFPGVILMADPSSPDLECGGGGGECFSDAEEGSCFYYSTCGEEDEEGRDCRICLLSLVGDDAIELGCCCKNDLAAAHRHCAETWFKIKGNKTCEICNSIVSNLAEMPMPPPSSDGAVLDVNLEAGHRSSTTRDRDRDRDRGWRCINGHRLLNLILACLVFAFVISWLFHFNIPS